jgi:hypothetical protein
MPRITIPCVTKYQIKSQTREPLGKRALYLVGGVLVREVLSAGHDLGLAGGLGGHVLK